MGFAYWAINAKRVDFALMDPDTRVVRALEYQGSGITKIRRRQEKLVR